MGASYAPERLDFAVGKSNYSRVSCHEYDFDRAEHLSLALDTNCSFGANVACADARFLWYCNLCLSSFSLLDSVDRANFARVRQPKRQPCCDLKDR